MGVGESNIYRTQGDWLDKCNEFFFFKHSSRGINSIPMGIENMIKRSLCSSSARCLC